MSNPNQAAWNDLITTGVELGRNLQDRMAAKKLRRQLEAERIAQAKLRQKALEQAKSTGVFPAQFQRAVAEDDLAGHIGVKLVALRELQKLAPNHPLVTSSQFRELIARTTVANFCRADRPAGVDFKDFSPTEAQITQLAAKLG